jgi:hypothetical protein
VFWFNLLEDISLGHFLKVNLWSICYMKMLEDDISRPDTLGKTLFCEICLKQSTGYTMQLCMNDLSIWMCMIWMYACYECMKGICICETVIMMGPDKIGQDWWGSGPTYLYNYSAFFTGDNIVEPKTWQRSPFMNQTDVFKWMWFGSAYMYVWMHVRQCIYVCICIYCVWNLYECM